MTFVYNMGDESAKYTITLYKALSLMTVEQKAEYNRLWSLLGARAEAIKSVYHLYYSQSEINQGTPLGYLYDFNRVMISHLDLFLDLLSQLDDSGYLKAKKGSNIITDIHNENGLRTPNLQSSASSNSTFIDTPQSNLAITDEYASTKNNSSSNASSTGTEANQVDYTHTKTTDEFEYDTTLLNLQWGQNSSIIMRILTCFYPCFIGILN